jgi:hypothetical protein
MGLEFLRSNGARRMRDIDAQPLLLDDGLVLESESDELKDLNYEVPGSDWQALDLGEKESWSDWPLRPRRFIDGKDVGRTVAWLQSREGYPVPVRLSQIGAVVMHEFGGELRREFHIVDRVVSMMVDLFQWDEVESFAIALGERGYRLLPSRAPMSGKTFEGGWTYDFERMRRTTQNRSHDEMVRLERQVLARDALTPAIVDGRLEPHRGAFDETRGPIAGLIKIHSQNYLHPQGWRVLYNLRPGQRTPAFHLQGKMDLITWYVRLDGARGDMPNWGFVRIEIPQRFFEMTMGRDWGYVNRLSSLVYRLRCHDGSYSRAAVSIHPVQRAEESLGAIFNRSEYLVNQFYRLTNL